MGRAEMQKARGTPGVSLADSNIYFLCLSLSVSFSFSAIFASLCVHLIIFPCLLHMEGDTATHSFQTSCHTTFAPGEGLPFSVLA